LAPLIDSNLQLAGPVNAQFDVTGRQWLDLAGTIQVQSKGIEVEGAEAHQVNGTVRVRDGKVAYDVSADVFDGEFSAHGLMNLADDPKAQWAGSGRFSLERGRLGDVMRLVDRRSPPPLDGLLDVELEFAHDPSTAHPTGEGRIVLGDVRWEGREIAPQLETPIVVTERGLRVPELVARVGGGAVRASAALRFAPELDGEFQLVLDRVSSDVLLAEWPEMAKSVRGAIDANLRGSIGRRIVGGGTVGAARLEVAGLEATRVRLPVRFQYLQRDGHGEIKIEESTAEAAHGRIKGAGTIAWHQEVSLSGKLALSDVSLTGLAGPSLSLGGLGAGRISGKADFSSKRFRSLNDLQARFDLKFAQARAAQIPVMSEVLRYVVPSAPSSSGFQNGELHGRLAGGVARIDRLAMIGTDSRLFAEGTVTLAGRLRLDVVALPGGDPLSRGVLRRFALPIIEAQTVPLTLLTRANDLLADQLLYLRVSGTVRSPNIQVRAAPQLQYEALRFLLTGALSRVALP
jgi:hypothetical protein